MNSQQKLLTAIQHRLLSQVSLIDAIAGVLGISYDAAHRRISQKSKFSIEETVSLCRHYGISMDSIFMGSNKVIVEKTAEITSMAGMEAYFKHSAENISSFLKYPDARMYYSAKDIPLFYMIGGSLLSKFKLYVWVNLLAGTQNQQPFEAFTVTQSMQQYTNRLKNVYETVEVHEIWNDTTINSTLQQVYYFFQSGLLSLANALLLCADLNKVLQTAEERCCNSTDNFNMYYNELLILNNNVLLAATGKQSLFVPYTMLGYFITDDAATCGNALTFFKHQIKNSKSLNNSGTRDRKLFFNKALQKIDFYRLKIENEAIIEF